MNENLTRSFLMVALLRASGRPFIPRTNKALLPLVPVSFTRRKNAFHWMAGAQNKADLHRFQAVGFYSLFIYCPFTYSFICIVIAVYIHAIAC